MHKLSETKQLSHLRKRVNCLKADVWCFKRKWVNHRLLGVNYVRQTMGLTEPPSERYQLMILSHSCPCVCLQSTCPALLLLFSSVCPMWLECITIYLLFRGAKTTQLKGWSNSDFVFVTLQLWRMTYIPGRHRTWCPVTLEEVHPGTNASLVKTLSLHLLQNTQFSQIGSKWM